MLILARSETGADADPKPLRGKLLKYDSPFEPLAPAEDREAFEMIILGSSYR